MKKLLLWAFVSVLVLSVTMGFRVSPVFAQEPYIGVYPSHIIDVKSPDTFNVKINVSSTTPFVGYQFYLYWNRTYINATGITDSTPTAWTAFSTGAGLQWNYNASHGRIERAVLDTHSPFVTITGTFTVMTITFEVLMDAPPPTVVHLTLKETLISDEDGVEITHTPYDGDVTVIPEFPIFLIIPLFIATTLVTVILRRKSFLKMRRSSFVAK